MKNAILAFALAAIAVSCTQASEEVAVDTTLVAEDTTIVEEVEVEGAEASAE